MDPSESDKPEPAQQASLESLKEEFVSLLTAEQQSLRYYLITLLGDYNAAENVLQETNIVIWRKSKEFIAGSSFSKWARKIAYWQALAYTRNKNRDRHVFSEELMQQIAARPFLDTEVSEARLALRHCLSQLSPKNRDLIQRRYMSGDSTSTLASRIGGSVSALHVRIHRIRRALLGCIQKQMESF